MRGGLGSNFITNTHKNNRMKVALAPGDGLLLEKVCYDKYNKLP
jgi:tRNA U38,U39,U40 pseudouridine synthase TruA